MTNTKKQPNCHCPTALQSLIKEDKTTAPKNAFIYTYKHGAHWSGKSWNVLDCPGFLQKYFNLSVIALNFFHLLLVSIFQCTVLI